MKAPLLSLHAKKEIDSCLNEALALQQQNDLEPAEALYLAILAVEPNHVSAMHLLGVLRHQRGDFLSAAETLQRALSLNPRSALVHLNLGLSLWALNRREDALAHFRHSVRFNPDNPDALFQCAYAFQSLQQPGEALKHWNGLLALDPNHPAALLNRGMVLQGLNRSEEAQASFNRALALDSTLAETLLTRALRFKDEQRYGEALVIQDQVLKVLPTCLQALIDRGGTLLDLGRPREALSNLDLALFLDPHHAEVLFCRATALLELQRPAEALESCDRALVIQPDCVKALINRGAALVQLNRFVDALATTELALALSPDDLDTLVIQGFALHLLGRNEEALATYAKALASEPGNAAIHSRIIGLLDHLPEVGVQGHQAERRRYFEAHARHLEPPPPHAERDRHPLRRLVLGYVSHSFMHCSTASIFLPILQRHSRADFQINCYSGSMAEDDLTERIRACAEVWRQATYLTDDALAAQIRADGVDILIDLSGHTVGNRLLTFARKPAPIQVTAWGHGGGTGLPMVDYLFADPVAIPPSVRPLFAEQVFDLPCHISFEAPPDAPALVDLPALAHGHVTFGCLNRYAKVTSAVEQLWAGILKAIPDSRLLLKAEMFDGPKGRAVVQETFARLGIGLERIDLRGATSHRDHMATFGEVDIQLDPFPLNGGITTLESLWMGTPVITKMGDTIGSRASGAILHALALPDWVAESEEEYLDLAVRKAADIDALARFRQEIRPRFLASAAGNPERYTRAVEKAFRAMWIKWVSSQAL
jgi:predicted O-linked N-acetylglucosamine transferase (SPINDLY family)